MLCAPHKGLATEFIIPCGGDPDAPKLESPMSTQTKAITRQELYEKIWKHPLKQIAEELETNYIELVQAALL